jgi:hypothetical protein
VQTELLPHLLRVMDVKIMTGSEGQRKLTLGNATILAYCLRWAEFRVCSMSMYMFYVEVPSNSMMRGQGFWTFLELLHVLLAVVCCLFICNLLVYLMV